MDGPLGVINHLFSPPRGVSAEEEGLIPRRGLLRCWGSLGHKNQSGQMLTVDNISCEEQYKYALYFLFQYF